MNTDVSNYRIRRTTIVYTNNNKEIVQTVETHCIVPNVEKEITCEDGQSEFSYTVFTEKNLSNMIISCQPRYSTIERAKEVHDLLVASIVAINKNASVDED